MRQDAVREFRLVRADAREELVAQLRVVQGAVEIDAQPALAPARLQRSAAVERAGPLLEALRRVQRVPAQLEVEPAEWEASL